ncbi:hypothetical protein VQH23_06455 [Pararoseomonas sp. SCSIO 73927]|uniref:hypothetical protein n=1 Tax=Pararoseomonas sp. SCSIO 73927 TaxID=3114537 RepID=UPI0030D5C569
MIVGEAFDRVLASVPSERLAATLGRLRAQLEHCLTEAPVSGATVGSIELRARLAAAIDSRVHGRGTPI